MNPSFSGDLIKDLDQLFAFQFMRSALEANAREYVPAASAGWEKKFPGIFDVRDGWLKTAGLDGPGLCTSL